VTETPWTRLSARLIERWKRQEVVLFAAKTAELREELADWLAGHAGVDDLGARLADWLVDQDAVEDVFADDAQLSDTVRDEARQLAASDPEAVSDDPVEPDVVDQLVARFGRPSFRPEIRHGDGPLAASKFGGTPYLPAGEEWPVCPGCGEPMQFFVQLDLASLPEELSFSHRAGLVQLFYCTGIEPPCEVEHAAWEPGARSVLARWLPPVAAGSAKRRKGQVPPHQGYPRRALGWKPAAVTRWTRIAAEVPGYGEPLGDPAASELLDEHFDDLYERDVVARTGDKLGGWPAWVQDPVYPRCELCERPMRYLLQLESGGLCGHQFGDLGAGHLFQCDEHPEKVAFSWACH
jgi:hypothetical protein